MVTPCIENSWLYVSGETTRRFGAASWIRMRIANDPASVKKAKPVYR
jgi:hypothetical protein